MKAKISFEVDIDIRYCKRGNQVSDMSEYDKEALRMEIENSLNLPMSLPFEATDQFGKPTDAIAQFSNYNNVEIEFEQ